MKKIFSLLALLLIINTCKSQVAVFKYKTFVDSISQPGLKKYGIKLSFDGINVPVVFYTELMSGLTNWYGDSIPNISNSINPNVQLLSLALNANNTNEVIAMLTINLNADNVLTLPLVSSPSGLNCDGKIHLALDTINYNISTTLLQINDTQNVAQTSSNNILNVDNLCSGKYTASITYTNTGITSFMQFKVLIGSYVFPSTTGLNIDVNTYKNVSSPSCDGKARVSITNSVVPFLCAFDGGSYSSTDSIINLCEGMHNVLVATVNDTVGKYFIISNSGNVINNPNSNGIVVDTITYNFTNCNFNYNLPIDSAFLNNYTVIDSNTIYFSWQIWQGGTVTAVSDTISYLYQTGNNMVSLNIFCGNGRTSSTANFKTFRINDYVNLIHPVGIEKLEQASDFSVYPNPFNSNLIIKSTSIEEIKSVKMINILGEEVSMYFQKNKNEYNLNTESLLSGYYTVLISSKTNVTSAFKIIKQ